MCAGGNAVSRGCGEHLGAGVVGRTETGYGGGEGAGGVHVLSKTVELAEIVTGKGGWSGNQDEERGGGTSPPKPMLCMEGSQGVKPQGRMR